VRRDESPPLAPEVHLASADLDRPWCHTVGSLPCGPLGRLGAPPDVVLPGAVCGPPGESSRPLAYRWLDGFGDAGTDAITSLEGEMSEPKVMKGAVVAMDFGNPVSGRVSLNGYLPWRANPDDIIGRTKVAILPFTDEGVGPIEPWMVKALRRRADSIRASKFPQGAKELYQIAAALQQILEVQDE